MNTIANYTVGAIKTFRGHDGIAYSCNLLRNGKKVAEVVDDGYGGGLQFYWSDSKTSATVNTLNYKDEPYSREGTVEEALFEAEVLKLPMLPARGELSEMRMSAELLIDNMVNDAIVVKKVTADLKKKFTIKASDGKMLTWKISPTNTVEVLKAHVIKKYPNAKIMNELPVAEVIRVYKEEKLIV